MPRPASATTLTNCTVAPGLCRADQACRSAASASSRPTNGVSTPATPRRSTATRSGRRRSTSQVSSGWSWPLTCSGAWALRSNRPCTRRAVSWLMRSVPGGACCSMRAARLTVAPRMVLPASTPPPSSTGPVCRPTRTLKPGWPCSRFTWSASRRVSARMAKPAATAFSASSSRASSVPKAASRLSPAYCKARPWKRCTSAVNRASAGSITSCRSSGSSCPLSAVDPTTSTNITVTWRSCCSVSGWTRSAASR